MDGRSHAGRSQALIDNPDFLRELVERGRRNVSVDVPRRLAVALGVPALRLLWEAEEEFGQREA